MTIAEQIQSEADAHIDSHFNDFEAVRTYQATRESYIAGATKHAEMAIEFKVWCDQIGFAMLESGEYGQMLNAEIKSFSVEQLYELFLTDKNKQK